VNTDRVTAWGNELREVHDRLRKALAVARESMRDGADAVEPRKDLLLYCRGFCLALAGHHQSEDHSLFPKIIEERPDLAPVIAKLSQDHSMIDYLITGLEKALANGADAVEQLHHLDGIEAIMESHFRYEERQLIEVLNAAENLGQDRAELFGPLA
jgi:hemerythrin-like domain-containing protein